MVVFFAPHSDHEHIAGRRALSAGMEMKIDEAAQVDSPLLITGPAETAAWVARLVYLRSARCEGPFRVLDPADDAISFGDRLARILGESVRGAAGGMLYLRDVAQASVAAQHALNGWLASDRGRSGPRLVASSSRPLEERVEAGLFDRSLFQRIARMEIRLADLPDTGA